MNLSWLSKKYRPVNQEDIFTISNPSENGKVHSNNKLLIGVTAFVLFFIGFVAGILFSRSWYTPNVNRSPHFLNTAPQIAINSIAKIFKYDDDFAKPPPTSGGPEAVWDSLVPNGLGYVKYPENSRNTSVLSVFHQLHCLYTIRRIYYSKGDDLQGFDFALNRSEHAGHCFEYLRQSIQCSGDSTLEPAGHRVEGFLGWGFERVCKDYGQLMKWADKWRAFEGHGFIGTIEEPQGAS